MERRRRLYAIPKSVEESEQIQREWFAMGMYWTKGCRDCKFTNMPQLFSDGLNMSYTTSTDFIPEEKHYLYERTEYTIESCIEELKSLKQLINGV